MTWVPGTWEVEEGGSRVQGEPKLLHRNLRPAWVMCECASVEQEQSGRNLPLLDLTTVR